MIEKRRGLGLGTSSSAGNSSTNEKSSDQNTKGMVSSSLIEMLVSQTAKIKAAKSQPQIELVVS